MNMARALPNVPDPKPYSYGIKSFIKGLDQSVDIDSLPLGVASDMHNVDVSTGALERMNGCTKLYNDECAAGIKNLMKFYPSGSTGYILACSDSAVYKRGASSWSEILSGMTSPYYDFIGYQIGATDYLIFHSLADGIKKYNGTTVTALANSPATVKAIELHKERVWVLYSNNTVMCSDDLNPENWTQSLTEGGQIEVPTWDGETLVGLKSAFDRLILTKERSMHFVYGDNPDNFSLVPIYSTRGAIANDSIVFCENLLIFLAYDGVYAFTGSEVKPFNTEKIKTHIANINQSYINRATAVYYDRKYIIAIPTGSSTTNNLILEFDFETGAWSVREDITVYDFLEFDKKLYYADGTTTIKRYDYGNTYDGTAIDADWTSGEYGDDSPDIWKNFEYLYLTYSGTAAGTLYFDYWIDNQTMQTITITLAATLQTSSFPMSGEGKRIKFRFRNVSGADFTVKKPLIKFSVTTD